MSDFKDHFSRQSEGYGLYRPSYPEELFAFLAELCPQQESAWDCGCGTGQAAHGLARYFRHVVATDASAAQVEKAVPGERIAYRVAPAEASELDDSSVDLVLVAQALHWFDFDKFYDEVRRVCRPAGVLAAVGYGLMRISPEIDRVIDHFYVGLLGGDWPEERRHIDNDYASVPFPFSPLSDEHFTMQAAWNYDHCIGYLETWSAVQHYRQRAGRCPVTQIADELLLAWGDRGILHKVTWPILTLFGRV